MFNFAYGPVPDIVLEPGFLERLREAFPKQEAETPGGQGAERFPVIEIPGILEPVNPPPFLGRRPPSPGDRPPMLRPPLPGDPGYDPTLPPGYMEPSLFEDQESINAGIAALMPAVEEEKYKKYIASDTNPFESMGVSSLGQNALRQMIFERANPSVNQQKNYKSYIG